MVKRVTLRRRNPYHTARNKIRQVKTPGARLVVHYVDKLAKGVRCRETGVRLSGIPVLRPREYAQLNKRQRSVSRAYGGCLSHKVVKDRIVRAFLTEEVKVIKKKAAQAKKK
jgi:large subunit ribosomal protein L34e